MQPYNVAWIRAVLLMDECTLYMCVCVLGAHRHPIKDAVALHSTASDSTEIMSDFLGG